MKFKATSDKERRLQINWKVVEIYVSRYKPNTVFDIEITRRQKLISSPMRKYYFSAVLPPYMEELGYDRDEDELFHRQLKITFFRIKKDKKGIYRGVPSVFGNKSKIPISEKKKFIEWVIRKAAEDGCYISDPGE